MRDNINIFYSWQSDLIGNKTKWLLNEVIEELVLDLSDTLTIYADRDTKNCAGSPDIVQTILNKINQSDLFIADVSIVGSYDNQKYTSNPNVLFELGYAVNMLGWDNIICIMNTDYGCVEQLPFDIRQHRILTYSINKDGRSKAKKQLKEILKDAIINARYTEKPSSDKVQYNVGCYNFNTNKVEKRLTPINIRESEFVLNFKSSAVSKIKELIELIKGVDNNKMICSKLEGMNLIKLQDELTGIQDKIYNYTHTDIDENFFLCG